MVIPFNLSKDMFFALRDQFQFNREMSHDRSFPFYGESSLYLASSCIHIAHCRRHIIHVIVSIYPSRDGKPYQFEFRIPVLTRYRIAVCHERAYLRTANASFNIYLYSQSLCRKFTAGDLGQELTGIDEDAEASFSPSLVTWFMRDSRYS
jgi:hypothetical protein